MVYKKNIREKLLQHMEELELDDYFGYQKDRFGFVEHHGKQGGVIGIQPPEETPAAYKVFAYGKDAFVSDAENGFDNFKNDFLHEEVQAWRYDAPPVDAYEAYGSLKNILTLDEKIKAGTVSADDMRDALEVKKLGVWLKGEAEHYLDHAEKQLAKGSTHEHYSGGTAVLDEPSENMPPVQRIKDEYVGYLANADFLETVADFGILACRSLGVAQQAGLDHRGGGSRS